MSAYDYKLKVTLVGAEQTGKTQLVSRLLGFEPDMKQYISTIGVDFLTKYIQVENKKIKLALWDTSGHERYNALIPNYLRDANIIMLCFDITSKPSFERLTIFYKMIDKDSSPRPILMLVGTKCELENERQVSKETAQKYAQELGAEYIETSAASDINVKTTFEKAAQAVLQRPQHAQTTQRIINRLEKYKSRIESHQVPQAKYIDFKYGFWMVLAPILGRPSTRAKNREANYLLTCALLTKLKSGDSIDKTALFSKESITRLRDEKSADIFKNCCWKRGIWSSELNAALKDARKSFHQIKKC